MMMNIFNSILNFFGLRRTSEIQIRPDEPMSFCCHLPQEVIDELFPKNPSLGQPFKSDSLSIKIAVEGQFIKHKIENTFVWDGEDWIMLGNIKLNLDEYLGDK